MSLLPPPLTDAARDTLAALRAQGFLAATAESCTGGLVAAALTAIAGSSDVVDRGFVTYSNQAKQDMLGVSPQVLNIHGAVSEQTAREMALGALAHSRAQVAVAITGIAGPGGGSPEKPVGLVHFAAAGLDGMVVARHEIFTGDRDAVRLQAALQALQLLMFITKACA